MALLDKAKHLAAIHSADPLLWPVIVPHMLERALHLQRTSTRQQPA